MATIDWNTLLTADEQWPFRLLQQHTLKNEDKLVLRTYTLKATDPTTCNNDIVTFIKDSVKSYVLTKREIALEIQNNSDPLQHALQYFGKINPLKDGKYGELILYLLVESILKIPMVVLKIPSSLKDQQKGSDGIFCGIYNGDPAILLGESKTWKDMNAALNDAFKSLDKLYTGDQLKQEYFVAKKEIWTLDLTADQLDYLYSCFTQTTAEHLSLTKVHPVLIIYTKADLKETIEKSQVEVEKQISQLVENKINENFEKIKSLCAKYQAVSKFNLDFFFIPVQCVDNLREELYEIFHGEKWVKKTVIKRKKTKNG